MERESKTPEGMENVKASIDITKWASLSAIGPQNHIEKKKKNLLDTYLRAQRRGTKLPMSNTQGYPDGPINGRRL